MPKMSKRMRFLSGAVADLQPMGLGEAVALLQSLETKLPKGVKPSRADQTVEIAVRLGIDPRHADQIVRGSIVYPHGIGKTQRVLVFCQGPNVQLAEAAGADFVGGKELAEKVKDGWTDFDVAIATPDMMGVVGPLGRVLGPRGLMPSPKAGTVTQDVSTVVSEYKAGKVEFRCDDAGIVHCMVGKMSFAPEALLDNANALLALVRQLKPQSSRGQYVKSVTLTATQMPGVPVVAI